MTQRQTFVDRCTRPALRLPAGACDSHCHVFGPADRFPYAEARRYTPMDVPRERLFARHRRLGFERGVIVQASCHGSDNRALVDALEAGAGRYRGIAMLDADVDDITLETLHRAGVRGVRFNFVSHLGEDALFDDVRRMAKRIAPLGWHITLHFECDRWARIAAMLDDLPLSVVIDHMGRPAVSRGMDQPAFVELLDRLDDPRLWVKVSGCERITRAGPPYADAVPFARRVVERIPDRVLWGTDFPHPNIRPPVPDDGALVDLLAEIAPDESLRHGLLVDNPTRLYWSV